jgi:hypothetical protein
MKTIEDESELPTPLAEWRTMQWYLRSKNDPTVLIEYHDGRTFCRRDGKRWEHPAYERHSVIGSNRHEKKWGAFQPKSGYCDDAVYPYEEKAAA